MKVIRGDIIADQIKFTVGAQTYRGQGHGQTRLDTIHKAAAELGFELEDVGTMQAIPIRDESYVVVLRSQGAPEREGLLPVRIPPIA